MAGSEAWAIKQSMCGLGPNPSSATRSATAESAALERRQCENRQFRPILGSNLGTKVEASWPKRELSRAQGGSDGGVRSAVHEAPATSPGCGARGRRWCWPTLANIGGRYQYNASYLYERLP